MLLSLFKRFGANQKSNPITATSEQAASLWQDTGQVYYLENTLKLTYRTASGSMTLEHLSVSKLAEVIQTLDELPANSPLARAQVAQQDEAFVISVCGVTWQKNGDTVRIKALPEAAILRSTTACFSRSQAVFKHAFLLEHDDLMTPTRGGTASGKFIYNRISPNQFVQQLARANQRIEAPLRRAIPVHPDNFNSAFTEHEQRVIEQVLEGANGNELIPE